MKGSISIKGARANNLKNIDVTIPWHKITVITGLSGSGKSSLALDTLYSEGLRRYVECLSTYARQFFERVERPEMDDITGLPPVIAIEARNRVKHSRSTVGTSTEVYDYLRLLFAKIGTIICPSCGREVKHRSAENIAHELMTDYDGKEALITFLPMEEGKFTADYLLRSGFTRILHNGETKEIEELESIPSQSEVVVDIIRIFIDSQSRLIESLELALVESDSIFVHFSGSEPLKFSKLLDCPFCPDIKFMIPTPILFSFNSPHGACPFCSGFGNILDIDPQLIIPNPELSIRDGAIEPLTKPSLKKHMKHILALAKELAVDVNAPYKDIPDDVKDKIFKGYGTYPGVRGVFHELEEKSYKMHVRVFLSKYRSAFTCSKCKGSRIRKEGLWVKVGDRTIQELSDMPIDKLNNFFKNLRVSPYQEQVVYEVLKQIRSRVDFLEKVGLGYITLSRLSKTLSGGESQRVTLACQLGASLTETLYIMDEPSIGLHPRDIDRLLSIVKELRDRDNTIVIVEHDHEMIRSSDHIIELGPKAGNFGGEVVFQGTIKKLLKSSNGSLTGQYLSGEQSIPVPKKRRKPNGYLLTIVGASENNLKNINVTIPLGTFTCVTGVSGSGKSSLIQDVLHASLVRKFHGEVERVGERKGIVGSEHIKDVAMLDQSPIGRSSRSNPVTYIKGYDEIRKALAGTWEARAKGFTATDFSFNVQGGRCEACQGEGSQTIEMLFLADINVVCDECGGKRFKKEVLSVRYRGKNVNEILSMSVTEALGFFREIPALQRKLKILDEVGLGYLKLGQPAPTLSGGEAQRIKIGRELGRKDGKGILYILDEPTIGLHSYDINKLLKVLNKLVDSGNTVVIIEHNLDMIKSCDWIIDLGPEGGDNGGYVVAEGIPEDIVKIKASHTGRFLRNVLQ